MQPPPPPPPPPPPLLGVSPLQKDAEHIRLLIVFHYVLAGLSLLGVLFLLFHYSVMDAVFGSEGIFDHPEAPFQPKKFFAAFRWFYLIMGALFLVSFVLNIVSPILMQRRKHRRFSIVIAGLNCINMPAGTVLGVFTILVLMRPTVRTIYNEANEPLA